MSRLALCDASGPLTDLLQKMSGEDGGQWNRALTKFLRKENPWSVWRTVVLGGFKSAQDFLVAFEGESIYVSDWAKNIMSKPEFAQSLVNVDPNEEFDLEDHSVEELVSECRNASTAEVFVGAYKLGLEDCPPWIGPKLRLDYRNQPKGECRFIGMKPLFASHGDPDVFCVGRYGSELWLSSNYARPGDLWDPVVRWLFRRPRK